MFMSPKRSAIAAWSDAASQPKAAPTLALPRTKTRLSTTAQSKPDCTSTFSGERSSRFARNKRCAVAQIGKSAAL